MGTAQARRRDLAAINRDISTLSRNALVGEGVRDALPAPASPHWRLARVSMFLMTACCVRGRGTCVCGIGSWRCAIGSVRPLMRVFYARDPPVNLLGPWNPGNKAGTGVDLSVVFS